MNNQTPIYFDNAATTALDASVLSAMLPFLTTHYGNPSSLHHQGRQARLAVEEARKQVAALLGVKPQTLVFTSGGTESNNTAILTALRDLGCTRIITSRIEHHAVLHTVQHYAEQFGVEVRYVRLFEDGAIDQNDLLRLLQEGAANNQKTLVSLMHANNETGQLTELTWVAAACRRYGAIYHADCVQTIGHNPLNLSKLGVHLASASAHKFHGPKGTGLLYIADDIHPGALLFGGAHERGRRAGTENVAGITGLAKALHLAQERHTADERYISGLKKRLAEGLKTRFNSVCFNSSPFSLYTILSVSFPKSSETEGLLLLLDQQGIAVSGGSACSGGASHVMDALGRTDDFVTLRFSFSRFNKVAEIDTVLGALTGILQPKAAPTAS